MDIVVGTAGHIDHGKTALIKALTGVDTDRLPEEKQRGITVDLGFAEMSIGDVHVGFVDVPGHERFVKNMLAGASGIDLVLLVIAADEGVMPQTREHFDICRLLGIKIGIVVLTKTDLIDQETLDLAQLDAAELVAGSFLEKAPVISVSAVTGDGIETLKTAIRQTASYLPPRTTRCVARLPIDRSFSVKGFGAVVTGTLASGVINEGLEMQLLPGEAKVRVRGLQTHGKAVRSASGGKRLAVNLGGIDHSKVVRGMVLTEQNTLRTTQIFDAELEALAGISRPLRSRQRVRVHIGTVEALGRLQILNDAAEIAAGDRDFAQIRLEMPVAAIPGERFIVRSYSPQITIAGGHVIDALSAKHRKREFDAARGFLLSLQEATDNSSEIIRLYLHAAGSAGLNLSDIQASTAFATSVLTKAISENLASNTIVEIAGTRFVSAQAFSDLTDLVTAAIGEFHKRDPLAKGITREALRDRVAAYAPPEIFQASLDSLVTAAKIVLNKETVRLASHQTELSTAETALSNAILTRYKHARLEPPKLAEILSLSVEGTNYSTADARKYLQLFLDSGEIVKVTEEFYFAKDAINNLAALVRQFADATSDRLIDVPKFKELAGISRKFAIPLIEYFDRERITTRIGDKRMVLK